MKAILSISAATVLLIVAPGPCFALWGIVSVTRDRAQELGLDVRTKAAAHGHILVELEFKTEGEFAAFSPDGRFKDRSSVELRIGERDRLTVTAPLREDRSQPGRVVVRFTAGRTSLDQITLRVMAPDQDGGTAYQLQLKDFVGREQAAGARWPGRPAGAAHESVSSRVPVLFVTPRFSHLLSGTRLR